MSLPFYFDQHVPSMIANALRARGVDLLTTQEDGLERSPDEDLLRRATQLGRAMVTQDHDFLEIASRCQRNGQSFAGVVFCRTSQASISTIIRDLELIAEALVPDDVFNTVVWIPF